MLELAYTIPYPPHLGRKRHGEKKALTRFSRSDPLLERLVEFEKDGLFATFLNRGCSVRVVVIANAYFYERRRYALEL